MIRNSVTFLLLLTTMISLGQTYETTPSSKIQDVTIFLQGAQVHRNAKVSLKQGVNTIKLEGLPYSLQNNSIQAKLAKNNVTILSVSSEKNYLNEANSFPRVREIKDSLEDAKFKLDLRKSHLKVYKEEKKMLLANKKIGGDIDGVDVENLMEMSDFFRERLKNVETKILDINRTTTQLQKTISRLQSQLYTLQGNSGTYSSDVFIKVSSEAKQIVGLDVSYLVGKAYWIPKYDIRSETVDGPIDLTYKADVFQSTGVDWKNVKLKLSTGNPSVDNTQPELDSWHLSYYDPNEFEKSGRGRKNYSTAYGWEGADNNNVYDYADVEEDAIEEDETLALFDAAPMQKLELKADKDRYAEQLSSANTAMMNKSNVSTEFDIDLPYSIASDGQANVVEIQKYKLPVDYDFFSVPKYDNDAFLLANISGWGDYNLMPGYMNVYFEGTYVGQSYLNTNTTNDTLQISLGRDQSIIIKREKIKDYCQNSTSGSSKKTQRGYEISVRNNKNTPIEIELQDQIPLSNDKEIEIDIDDLGGAKYNEKTGELSWTIKLEPSTTKSVSFKYQVKYPKNWEISNL